ncbi:S-methyl-5'-thioadenosine phosphorylase [Candidatus Geothermarchaeota archaeon]|nr:MAG: S-methyl-5'-thioadenosine phosphorylase [Candidatus Geothermarchaeota archaeon]HEW94157.1 S-methyl-5'-thioadenosine phosphorylase [Thermoprotei archaeon]
MYKVGVIGGSGFETLISEGVRKRDLDRYGSIDYTLGYVKGIETVFIPRHGFKHEYPPHKIPFKAMINLLNKLDIDRVIGISAVGSLREDLPPGSIAIPIQLIDYTIRRDTFYEDHPIHVDVSRPYCRALIKILLDKAEELGIKVEYGLTYVATEGPRFETPSEIRMFKVLGGDLVGMTNIPEAILAREAGMHYALITLVTNYAAGMQDLIDMDEVYRISKMRERDIFRLVEESIPVISSSELDDECIRFRGRFREVSR